MVDPPVPPRAGLSDHGGEGPPQDQGRPRHLVAAGTTNKEAARRLFIGEATVKTHLLHLYAELGVRDRAAAVAAAYKAGLLDRPARTPPPGR